MGGCIGGISEGVGEVSVISGGGEVSLIRDK